jgi:hypothetical protein
MSNTTNTHQADQWTPELRRLATASYNTVRLHGCDGVLRLYKLENWEPETGGQVGYSLMGEDLVVQYDNMVPEEVIVYADHGTEKFLRLGIATAVPDAEPGNEE